MKITIIAGLVVLFGFSTAYASGVLVKGTDFATVGIGSDTVSVSKFQDGKTTCYVTRMGKFGAHAISCVK